jgi:hypothetical protein
MTTTLHSHFPAVDVPNKQGERLDRDAIDLELHAEFGRLDVVESRLRIARESLAMTRLVEERAFEAIHRIGVSVRSRETRVRALAVLAPVIGLAAFAAMRDNASVLVALAGSATTILGYPAYRIYCYRTAWDAGRTRSLLESGRVAPARRRAWEAAFAAWDESRESVRRAKDVVDDAKCLVAQSRAKVDDLERALDRAER